MDSLTQIALGAAVGEAVAGKKAGNKAVLWGAVLGTVPDLDVVSALFLSPVDYIFFHRGFSHSLVFFILSAPVFGWLLRYINRKETATWKDWTLLSFWVLFTHALLDCFTSWGTQLFWPLDYRVAFNSIFIVDPLYTLPLLVTVIWMMFYKRDSSFRRRLNYAGLILSTCYLTGT
ncbi:MAG: metal-dependent hydrolase, partial [Chloroflexi bacterium]